MEITERLLNDAGGWQVLKQARAIQEMGRVTSATWEPPLLQGRVREGETEFRAGLRILSRTNIENLCTCRPSRQHGAICLHSIAVGLEYLRPRSVAVKPPAASISQPAATKAPAPAPAGPKFSTEAGTPVELHVILPPNLAAAWGRGNISGGVEVAVGGKRAMLPTLDPKQTWHCSEADLRLINRLRELGEGTLPGMLSLTSLQAGLLLESLQGHPRVSLGRNAAATVDSQPLRPPLKIGQGTKGELTLRTELPAGAALLRAGAAQPWVMVGNTLRQVAPGLPAPYHDLLEREIALPAEAAQEFVARELPGFRQYFAVEQMPDLAAPAMRAIVTVPVQFTLELEGSLNHLVAKLHAQYGEQRVTLSRGGRASGVRRNAAAEADAIERLRRSGFSDPDAEGQMILKSEPRILAFFARDLPAWERTATVEIGARFEHVTAGIERIRPRLEVRASGENWFELQVELATASGERFSGADIQRLLQSGQSHVRNRQGKITVFDPQMVDELQQTLRDCDPSQQRPGTYRMHQRQAGYLHALAAEQGAELVAPPAWRTAARSLVEHTQLQPVPLGSLEGTLRGYQKEGVNWMSFLARSRLGGILADEMGLGKTLQALAYLRAQGGRALIVCPSSLVYNWRREAARFTPERRVLAIEGADRRALFGRPLEDADLVITSYALLRRDAELWRGHEFETAILDEAQHIKNPETQNAQAAYAIRSRNRFVLTGTPVENSVRDLWSLMHFLMPGYLGTQEDFRERYEKPISSASGGPEQQRLTRRIRPFILRRRKRDVASELPEKLEQVAYCELSGPQRELYRKLVEASRREVAELADSKNQGKARMVMLTALLRLRQACCDPRLLQVDDKAGRSSAKVELFGELLQEALDGGHRVLVFSQFVGMLSLLKGWLSDQEIPYCYLDGSTKDRGAEVDRFQNGEIPVFLISLKAGGVGLNLTAADTVIHFDPWWNPAVEAQATDRAHRIGQKNVVTAYKLIARDTVEEKILTLQQKKRQVIEATVENEEPMMEGLTGDDLRELLA